MELRSVFFSLTGRVLLLQCGVVWSVMLLGGEVGDRRNSEHRPYKAGPWAWCSPSVQTIFFCMDPSVQTRMRAVE
jgi:hypothetical protein